MLRFPEIAKATLPPLYSQEKEKDPIVQAHFFFPGIDYHWFAIEGQQQEEEFTFFGWVIAPEKELGYFSLQGMEEVNVAGRTIQFDTAFTPRRLSAVKREYGGDE